MPSFPRFPPHRHVSGRDMNLILDFIEGIDITAASPLPSSSSPNPPPFTGITNIQALPPLTATRSGSGVLLQEQPYYVEWLQTNTGLSLVIKDPFVEINGAGQWVPHASCWAFLSGLVIVNALGSSSNQYYQANVFSGALLNGFFCWVVPFGTQNWVSQGSMFNAFPAGVPVTAEVEADGSFGAPSGWSIDLSILVFPGQVTT